MTGFFGQDSKKYLDFLEIYDIRHLKYPYFVFYKHLTPLKMSVLPKVQI